MRRRVTYRPGRANGIFGLIWGGIFVLIGLFVVIPSAGLFGLLWTLGAAAITGMNAYQTFGKNYAGPEINIEDEDAAHPHPETDVSCTCTVHDPARRLEQLETLKNAGLISEQEYREKRDEIIKGL